MQIGIVMGMSSHGLALCRALKKNNVKVYAIESNPDLPSVRTNAAEIIIANDINTDKLIDTLLSITDRFPAGCKPVVFPTNDKMVRILAREWDRLDAFYTLSWSDCRDVVLRMQSKKEIEDVCDEQGLNYPKSAVLNKPEDIDDILSRFSLPAIVKPVNPMSTFKVKLIRKRSELESLFLDHASALPFLIQQWIDGDDEQLLFCSMFMVDGEPIVTFTGRKLESLPRAMGQGTIMEPIHDHDAIRFSKQFFQGSGYTGPVSVEYKVDNDGKYWVIEPNIGRTEFCVQCALSNQVDLAGIEFDYASSGKISSAKQSNRFIWFDTEKDITCYINRVKRNKSLFVNGKKAVFPYLKLTDISPFYKGMASSSRRVFKKIKKVLSLEHNMYVPDGMSAKVFDDIEQVKDIFDATEPNAPLSKVFMTYYWYDIFIKNVELENKISEHFLCLFDHNNKPLAMLPMYAKQDSSKRRSLHSLTNYYSPIYDVLFDAQQITGAEALRYLFVLTQEFLKGFDSINISPVYGEIASEFTGQWSSRWCRPYTHQKSVNWFSTFEDCDGFRATLSSRVKNTYKRKLKRLDKREDWSFHYLTTAEEMIEALNDYDAVYAASWKKSEPSPEFIRNVCLHLAKENRVRLGIIRIEGKPVAAQIWMIESGCAYIYKLAYDVAYKDYSAGTILTYKICEKCIREEGVRTIDFLTGDDKFKTQWMTQQRQLLGIEWVVLKSSVGWGLFLRNQLSKVKRKLIKKD